MIKSVKLANISKHEFTEKIKKFKQREQYNRDLLNVKFNKKKLDGSQTEGLLKRIERFSEAQKRVTSMQSQWDILYKAILNVSDEFPNDPSDEGKIAISWAIVGSAFTFLQDFRDIFLQDATFLDNGSNLLSLAEKCTLLSDMLSKEASKITAIYNKEPEETLSLIKKLTKQAGVMKALAKNASTIEAFKTLNVDELAESKWEEQIKFENKLKEKLSELEDCIDETNARICREIARSEAESFREVFLSHKRFFPDDQRKRKKLKRDRLIRVDETLTYLEPRLTYLFSALESCSREMAFPYPDSITQTWEWIEALEGILKDSEALLDIDNKNEKIRLFLDQSAKLINTISLDLTDHERAIASSQRVINALCGLGLFIGGLIAFVITILFFPFWVMNIQRSGRYLALDAFVSAKDCFLAAWEGKEQPPKLKNLGRELKGFNKIFNELNPEPSASPGLSP